MDPTVAPQTRAEELLTRLRALANPANVAGMARYGINTSGTLGVAMPRLREIARDFRTLRRSNPVHVHEVAEALWASGVHEARLLAGIMDVPTLVTREQAERWVVDFDSWDVCDQVTGLFAQTPFAADLATSWAGRRADFVKRAGFVVVCHLAVHDKQASDEAMISFLPLVEREASDARPYVKKGVNWALRQIGKRSPGCHAAAVATAERILDEQAGSPSARWIARDALRELRAAAVVERFPATDD
ncbi:DNA alkylation repair protein [Propionicicella superfundia]|uniref:DNA alkylation repair protein n=1 Tax=Propionicicella superfundia TaxID=348582 RepID=UPI00055A7802|nr:DNA alkylation repair protein [Propionicicella superfundia]